MREGGRKRNENNERKGGVCEAREGMERMREGKEDTKMEGMGRGKVNEEVKENGRNREKTREEKGNGE